MNRRRSALLSLVLALALAVPAVPASASGDDVRTYKVTVENLTHGQPITPLVAATHDGGFRVFKKGHPASNGLQQLAENGGVPVLAAELAANPEVSSVDVVGSAPLGPGTSASAVITVPEDANRITLAGMLVCTNDGFAGLSRAKLPQKEGKAKTFYGRAWDAGTEINTEAYADLVPPCDGMGGSGMSNPSLAEGGVVHRHAGIAGGADLDPAVHGWDGPVVRVTIERVAVYQITVDNLTSGQPLTPFVFATHKGEHTVFRSGRAASNGLQQLSENGGVPVLAAELDGRRRIGTVAVVGAAPIGPGSSDSATVMVHDRYERASLAGMLVCTNDGFAGLDSIELPDDVGDTEVEYARAYDAGTEVNTEAYADLVPPCDGMGGSGMTNPALAQGGVVHSHAGIAGGADLNPAVHGWTGPVARVTITRTG